MDGAEQCGAGRGQCDEVVLARGSCGRLLGRLGDTRRQGRSRDGVGEPRQTGGLGGLRSEQTGDECLVEGVDGIEGLVEPGNVLGGLGEQIGAHQATALVGGNHCISGNGAVLGSSSRYAR